MNEKNLQPDEMVTYRDIQYRVLENRITPDEKRKSTLVKLNVISFATLGAVFILCTIAIVLLNGNAEGGFTIDGLNFLLSFLLVALVFVAFIVAHEYVHYLTYRFAGGTPKNSLKFGLSLKSGMAYCISLVPNTIKASRLSLMMPFYVLVIPTIIAAILFQSSLLTFMAALFASGSAGDFWYMWSLRKDAKDKYIIEAIPEGSEYEIGYLLLEKIED